MAEGDDDVKLAEVDVMTEDVDMLSLDDWKKRRTRLYQRFKKAYHKVELAISRKQVTAVAAFNALEDSFGDVYDTQQRFSQYCTENKIPDVVTGGGNDHSVVSGKNLQAWFAHVELEYETIEKKFKNYLKQSEVKTPVTPITSVSQSSSSNVTAASLGSTSGPQDGTLTHVLPGSLDTRALRSLYEKESFMKFPGSFGRAWVEWKCVYVTEIRPLYVGRPLSLARLIRSLVEGGKGAEVIAHISLQEEKPDEKMFEALCAHYDNIGLNVQCVLNDFAALKINHEPQGILLNIVKINAAYNQLESLGHVTQVDQSKVTQLVGLFPTNFQNAWYEKFSDLTAQDQFHPLKQFVDFLKTKQKSIEAQAVCAQGQKAPSRSVNNQVKSSVRSHSTQAEPGRQQTTAPCVMHPDQMHHSHSCRDFKALSARDRARLMGTHKRCKLCFLPKHEGPCHRDFSCKKCTGERRKSHHTMLCFSDSDGNNAQASTVKKPYGSSQSRQFAPKNNAISAHAIESDSPGENSHSQAGGPSYVPYGHPPHMMQGAYPPHPYMLPGINPFYTGSASQVSHNGGQQSMNMASVLNGYPGPHLAQYSFPPYMFGQSPNVGGASNVGSGASVVNNLSPNNGSNETNGSAKNHDSKIVDVHKSEAGPRCVSMSSSITQMHASIFKVKDANHRSELSELPHFDNILSAPRPKPFGLYAIVSCQVPHNHNPCVLFFDGGSDCALVLESSLKRLGARTVAHGNMKISTVNGTETLSTRMVEVDVIDIAGRIRTIVGYTVKHIMGRPYQLNLDVLSKEFPEYSASSLQRPKQEVDILLGADYFALFPKQELEARNDLSIMHGPLGKCVQGSHPDIVKRPSESGSHPNFQSVTVTFTAGDSPSGDTLRSDIPLHHRLKSSTSALRPEPVLKASSPSPEVFLDDVPSEPEEEEVENPRGPPHVPGSCSPGARGLTSSSPPVHISPADAPTTVGSHRTSYAACVDVQPLEQVCSSPHEAGRESVTEAPDVLRQDEVPGPLEDRPSDLDPGEQGGRTLPSQSAVAVVLSPCSPRGPDVIQPGIVGSQALVPGDMTCTCFSTCPDCIAMFAVAGGVEGDALDKFILGERLGTTCYPRCGSCKCAKCPLPGHSFSFQEEQELALIQSKMRYIEDPGRWKTGYPWVVPPESLPDNYVAAYSTLCRTERTLAKDPAWQATYQLQIEDHVKRGVARKLSPEEVAEWSGPVFYLSHMALEQPKSESTPVRLVFNSSQKYRGVSLNSCLAKGPDCYNCTLLGMLIRFREFGVVMIGDIRKMYNTVHLEDLECHMHRFLWRECDTSRKPDIYCITRVNLGDKPSGTIAITAKNNTAHMFSHICPEAAVILIYFCYTDDIIASIPEDLKKALFLSGKCEEILKKAEFAVKEWFFAGRDVPLEYMKKELKQVLGTWYNLYKDCIFFPVKLNFTEKRRNVPTGPDLTREDIPHGIPAGLTRRIVLQQVMAIYDPLGLLCPLVLQAKLLLRETWLLKLSWDEVLTPHMVQEWRKFFISLFDAADIQFDRCLTPENATGSPQLVLMSDGSEQAYGCAAYIRWELEGGGFWCRLMMAKSRISPIARISIPRMELNGAVISKRLRETIEEESRFEFSKVHHLIDSETVLCQLYKTASRFQVFEGVRIGEIQAAMKGDLSEWAWIAGTENAGDLATRPQLPSALGPDSVWQRGPDFLYLPEEQWPVKRNPHVNDNEPSPGEKAFCNKASVCSNHGIKHSTLFADSLTRTGSTTTSVGAIARILCALRARSFNASRSKGASPETRNRVFKMALQEAQCSAWSTEKQVKEQFKQIRPVYENDLWTVGSRDPRKLILSKDHLPQVLLPRDHILTKCLMEDFHVNGGHCGRDRTLFHFRSGFHTSRAQKLAEKITFNCQECKLRHVKLAGQRMGCPPVERFTPGLPFDSSILDMFGPYDIRDAVNKRGTSKIYGILIVDLSSGASHIEIATGYDSDSFLLAFQRFAALRGWPAHVYSDPGSQLKGVSTDITLPLDDIVNEKVRTTLARSGTEWHFGPADSPWYQGVAEALIKSAKASIAASIHGRRMGLAEMLTVFTQAANLLNERPIGYLPGLDNDISVLTPNNLLLGRSSAANPGFSDAITPTIARRLHVISEAIDVFWQKWTELYAPTLIKQAKWFNEERPFQKDDVVMVADSNVLKGEYRIAVVHDVHPSRDGVVRRVSIRYMIYRSMTPDMKLVDGRPSIVERSAQRLALLVPVNGKK